MHFDQTERFYSIHFFFEQGNHFDTIIIYHRSVVIGFAYKFVCTKSKQ